jgi:prephenate dehydratase
MKVGALGPAGTSSEAVAWAWFKGKFEVVTYLTISEVAKAVARGDVDAGVIPVESLREGPVGEALDALTWADVKASAEIVRPISYSLLTVKGSKFSNIIQVLSHPQALAQCKDFISKRLPKAELIEMTSTAKAAEQVSKKGDRSAAAIGPKNLAKLYRLQVLHDNVEGEEKNVTRFLVITKNDSKRTGNDKTSIVFSTEADKPGILYEILGAFASRRINLTKIESRPSKRVLGDYLFFIDLEGHREDERVEEALREVKKKTSMLKVIGSYQKKF